MREILFRGKTIPECIGWDEEKEEEIYSESKWIHGGYGEIYGSSYIMTPPFMKHITAGGSRWMDEEIDAIRVQEGTVGQYTDVDDLDGNKIFGGDIVRISAKPDSTNNLTKGIFSHHGETAVVIMEKGRWVAKKQLNKDFYYLIWLYGDDYDFTVIGNITDNPELLEEVSEYVHKKRKL